MKRLILPVLILISVEVPGNAQFTKIGGGIAAGTGIYFNNITDNNNNKSGIPAIFITGVYEIAPSVHLAPYFTYYSPHISKVTASGGGSTKHVVSCMMFDLNGRYVINPLKQFEFYGLAGFNITLPGNKLITEIGETTIRTKESDNAFGLNLGAGTYIKLTDRLDMSAEAKYILSKYDQFLFNVGFLINVDWLSGHGKTGIQANGLFR